MQNCVKQIICSLSVSITQSTFIALESFSEGGSSDVAEMANYYGRVSFAMERISDFIKASLAKQGKQHGNV